MDQVEDDGQEAGSGGVGVGGHHADQDCEGVGPQSFHHEATNSKSSTAEETHGVQELKYNNDQRKESS